GAHHGLAPERKSGAQHQVVLGSFEGGVYGALTSQFTLAADTKSGLRPSFSTAAPPALGAELFDYLVNQAKIKHPVVATGCFGADMQVSLVNDGPVTFLLVV
ncbi:D-aminoacyl-tRNA deacylase, partial [Pseudomonas turukhanskensis]|uniref:D-aminoacyl-tRNA deacylase n=1 Tax=Pseudomonas turukhanskensis TaxID=1806536 RepID=UPI0022F32BA9